LKATISDRNELPLSSAEKLDFDIIIEDLSVILKAWIRRFMSIARYLINAAKPAGYKNHGTPPIKAEYLRNHRPKYGRTHHY
jgi:hypothetical protein